MEDGQRQHSPRYDFSRHSQALIAALTITCKKLLMSDTRISRRLNDAIFAAPRRAHLYTAIARATHFMSRAYILKAQAQDALSAYALHSPRAYDLRFARDDML